MRFEDLNLVPPLLQALAECGYAEPTPIQAQTIPVLLAGGTSSRRRKPAPARRRHSSCPHCSGLPRRARGRAVKRRGVGVPGVLVLAPTRELAQQVGDAVGALWAERAAAHGLRVRRCAVSAAEPRARARRRRARRDAGPADGSHRARPRRPVEAAGARARRGRPDAGHGLLDDVERICALAPADAPDRAVLGDVRRRDRPARRASSLREAVRIDVRADGRVAASRSSSACISPTIARTSTGCSISCSPTSPGAEHRLHGDEARCRGAGHQAAGRRPHGRCAAWRHAPARARPHADATAPRRRAHAGRDRRRGARHRRARRHRR